MEPLILEIKTRGLHRYHPLNGAQTSIGRALDNDIIISDPTVAPYHLNLFVDDDNNIKVENLTRVNPARVNHHKIDSLVTTILPIDIELGRISMRLMSRRQSVPEARLIAGKGQHDGLFGHAVWSILVLFACVILSALDFYLDSYSALKWDALLKYVLRDTILSIAVFVFALSVLERLLVNRWEIKAILLSVSLVYLLYHLLTPLMDEMQYIFSSSLPHAIFHLGWFVFFIPLAVTLYLTQISHLNRGKSILIAILISSPIAFSALINNSLVNSLTSDFSVTAKYQKNLSAWNSQLADTVTIDKFIEQAKTLDAGEFVE